MSPRRKIEFPAEVHPEYLAELRRRIETGPGVGPVAEAAEMSRVTLWRTLNGGDRYQPRVTVDAVERARRGLESFGETSMPPPVVAVRGPLHHAWIEIGAALLEREPGELPALALSPRAPITTLRVRGHDLDPFELPVSQRSFTIGGHGCDLVIPRRISRAVSPRHARLIREGNALRVQDLGSRNGSFAAAGRPREDTFQVAPGGTFALADVELLATDLSLDAARAHLACAIGLDHDAAVDQAVIDVASGEPLLLLGARGTGARRLAAVLHATSPQRHTVRIDGAPVPGLIRFAHGATVYLDLDTLPAFPARYAAALFDRRRGLRLIFAATDPRHVRRCLDSHASRLRTIRLMPLAQRPADIVHLLQFIWATELASIEPTAALGPDALDALTTYPWPNNLEELHDHAPRLLAYHLHGGLRPAAASLGIRHQTLAQHLDRLGIPLVPQMERDLPLRTRRPALDRSSAGR